MARITLGDGTDLDDLAARVAVLAGSANASADWVPACWGQGWRQALTRPKAVLSAVGSSITAGYWASTRANGYVGRLAGQLQAEYGDGGTGYLGMARAPMFGANIATYPTGDKVEQSGTWSPSSGLSYGGPGSARGSSTTLGSTLTWRRLRGTTIRLYWLSVTAPGGTFTYSVDGSTPVTVATAGPNGALTATTISDLPDVQHTLVLTITSPNGANIYGASCERASGVVVNNFAMGGARTDRYAVAQTATWSGGAAYPADLVIYELSVNDAGLAPVLDPSATVANLRAYLDATRGVNPDTDVLVVAPHIGNHETQGVKPYADMIGRARGVCEAYNAAFVNIWARYRNSYAAAAAASYWGDDTAEGVVGVSGIHPGDTGHALIAAALSPLVVP